MTSVFAGADEGETLARNAFPRAEANGKSEGLGKKS